MSTQKLIKEPKFIGAMAILTLALGTFAFLHQPQAEADTLAPSVLLQPPQQHALVAETTPAPATPAKAEAPAVQADEKVNDCIIVNSNTSNWEKMKSYAVVTGCKIQNLFKSDKVEQKHEPDSE